MGRRRKVAFCERIGCEDTPEPDGYCEAHRREEDAWRAERDRAVAALHGETPPAALTKDAQALSAFFSELRSTWGPVHRFYYSNDWAGERRGLLYEAKALVDRCIRLASRVLAALDSPTSDVRVVLTAATAERQAIEQRLCEVDPATARVLSRLRRTNAPRPSTEPK